MRSEEGIVARRATEPKYRVRMSSFGATFLTFYASPTFQTFQTSYHFKINLFTLYFRTTHYKVKKSKVIRIFVILLMGYGYEGVDCIALNLNSMLYSDVNSDERVSPKYANSINY